MVMDIYDDIQINDLKTLQNIDEWKYRTDKNQYNIYIYTARHDQPKGMFKDRKTLKLDHIMQHDHESNEPVISHLKPKNIKNHL